MNTVWYLAQSVGMKVMYKNQHPTIGTISTITEFDIDLLSISIGFENAVNVDIIAIYRLNCNT